MNSCNGVRTSSRAMRSRYWPFVTGPWPFVIVLLISCRSSDPKPVDIFPEDICAECRMAISAEQFAAEFVDTKGEAYKFDDIGCMLSFGAQRSDLQGAVMFVKDYDTRAWLRFESATIVETGVPTPMGSGKIAFSDRARAMEFQRRYPAAGQ